MAAVFLVLISFVFIFSATYDSDDSTAEIQTGTNGSITWEYDTDTCELTIGGTGVLPEIFRGYFKSSVKSIEIEDGVTGLGYRAFRDFTALTSVVISDSVTSIGEDAFSGCSQLTSVVMTNSVTTIGSNAFLGCKSLTSVVLPPVSEVAPSVFHSCEKLTTVVIPDGATSIGASAFLGCKNLTSIVIPDGVTSIGGTAFQSCSKLTSVVMPDSVTSIGTSSFGGCTSLTSVVISSKITTLTKQSFYGCNSLTSVVIPEGVTSIETDVFRNCTSLTSIEMFSNVASIGNNSFFNTGLTTITLGGSSTSPNVMMSDANIWGVGGYKNNLTGMYNNSFKTIVIDGYTDLAGLDHVNDLKLIFTKNVDKDMISDSSGSSETLNILGNPNLSGSTYLYNSLTSSWESDTTITNKITFNSNGGSPVSDMAVLAGSTIDLPTTEKRGYTFDGWYESSDLSGSAFSSSYIVNGDKELHAKFEENSYNVSYDPNGGTGSMSSASVKYTELQANYPLEQCTFTPPENKAFLGWIFSGLSPLYDGGGTVSDSEITRDVTLYAFWAPGCTVSFYDDDGTTTLGTSSVIYGRTASFSGTTPTKTATAEYTYTFSNWYTATSGGSIDNLSNVIADRSVYANYSRDTNKYTVTFYDDDGTTSLGISTVPYGTAASFTGTTPTKTATAEYTYTFSNWYTATSGGSIDDLSDVTANRNVYANYAGAGKQYTVTFDAAGGTPDGTTMSVIFGSAYGTLQTVTRSGYTFNGWYLNETKITSLSVVFTSADHTLVAKWSSSHISDPIEKVKVTFDANGGDTSITSMSVIFGSAYGTLPTPTYDGHNFDGWYFNENKITSSSTVNVSYDHTLVAKWSNTADVNIGDSDSEGGNDEDGGIFSKIVTFVKEHINLIIATILGALLFLLLIFAFLRKSNVIFDENGGSEKMSSIRVKKDDSFSVPEYSGYKEGYAFVGWNDGSKTYSTKSEYHMNDKRVKFIAVWEKV